MSAGSVRWLCPRPRWRVRGNVLSKVAVKLGERDARSGLVVVREGLAEGDEVLRSPGSTLVDGQRFEDIPMNQQDFACAVPVYEYLPGWDEDISAARELGDLPANARADVRFLEEQSHCRISAIGVGQDRAETIRVHDLVD